MDLIDYAQFRDKGFDSDVPREVKKKESRKKLKEAALIRA